MATAASHRENALEPGPDGALRCWWATSSADYISYHDDEWGRPVVSDDELFERVCLEAFQSGLSWLTILRKRDALRTAFGRFRIEHVAGFGKADVERLLADQRIIRNRRKIEAVITNAKAAAETIAVEGTFAGLIWSFAPKEKPAPRQRTDIPAAISESAALAQELKRRGFRFVGPTTAYALMQACGLVNDHISGCAIRTTVEQDRQRAHLPSPVTPVETAAGTR